MAIEMKESVSGAEPGTEEVVVETTVEVIDESDAPPACNKRKITTTKLIVAFCLLNGIAWVWCSYILAWLGKEQIAESLSQVALTEIIAVVLIYAVKSVFENLSKNNVWPDKSD